MNDILIDPQTGDIELSADGDLQLTDSIIQQITIKLKWFAREWKMNRAYGIDYYGEMLNKSPSLAAIESDMIETILSVEGVTDVKLFKITVDRVTRTAYVNFTAVINGKTEEGRINLNV